MICGFRFFTFIFAFAFAVVTQASAKPREIVFINPGNDSGFWGEVSAVMRSASRQLGISVEVLHSDRDRLVMLALAEEVAEREHRPDIAIVVNELEQGSAMLRALTSAGIPVYFLLNSLTEDQLTEISKETGYVPSLIGSIAADNWTAGYEMVVELADDLAAAADRPANVLAILGDDVTPGALEREAGMRAAIEARASLNLVRTFSVLWDPEIAFERVKTALDLIEIDAIWAANDEIGIAARRAVDACGRRCDDVLIAGMNWSREGIEAVRRGEFTSSHGGHFLAGGIALAHIMSTQLEGEEGIPITLVMSSIGPSEIYELPKALHERNWDDLNFEGLMHLFNTGVVPSDPVSVLLGESG